MVNAWFPGMARYGFEIVHAHLAHRNRRIGHQWKIYGESRRRHFSQIFAELISMQTLALYQGSVVVKACAAGAPQRETDDWSQDVVPAAFDVLARAGAGAAAPGQDA
jgi:hypothetical protein